MHIRAMRIGADLVEKTKMKNLPLAPTDVWGWQDQRRLWVLGLGIASANTAWVHDSLQKLVLRLIHWIAPIRYTH